MNVQDVLSCSFSSWYPVFKNATITSVCIPLTSDFVKYLLSDGVVLPGNAPSSQKYDTDSEDEVDWSEADDDSTEIPCFPELEAAVAGAIKRLGGRVFPKLNWSSPKDATWIATNNSPCCTCFADICLLLKSSDFVTHDLTQPFKACIDRDKETGTSGMLQYELVLRKWVEIDPSTEFRCFVKDSILIGISQRDYTHYYYHIEEQESNIIQDITSFFHERIKSKFASTSYVFDVYRKKKDVVKLLDFNPFGAHTDSLLFEWEELENLKLDGPSKMQLPIFRYMRENRGVQPSPYRHYALPRDVVDLCAGEDAHKLIDLMNLIINGVWLLYYVIIGNRKVEEFARNNWTVPRQEKRQAIAAAELHSGLSDVESKNTSTQAPPDVSKEAPPNATELNIIGELPVSGYVFDLIFGTETALNLASDIMMQVSLCSWKSPGTKVKLRVFFGWNCFSTGVCYLASLFLADFRSRTAEFHAKQYEGIDEPTFRGGVKTMLQVVFTLVLLVKISVLGGIFVFLYNWDTPSKEPDRPGGGAQAQPVATATQGAGTAGGDTTMTDHSE